MTSHAFLWPNILTRLAIPFCFAILTPMGSVVSSKKVPKRIMYGMRQKWRVIVSEQALISVR